jgi:hypothetical protein
MPPDLDPSLAAVPATQVSPARLPTAPESLPAAKSLSRSQHPAVPLQAGSTRRCRYRPHTVSVLSDDPLRTTVRSDRRRRFGRVCPKCRNVTNGATRSRAIHSSRTGLFGPHRQTSDAVHFSPSNHATVCSRPCSRSTVGSQPMATFAAPASTRFDRKSPGRAGP